MPNIRVDLEYTIYHGLNITFKSPTDCSTVTGLILYYPNDSGTTVSKVFQFADAHGNNVGSVSLFAENVLVKVIIDTEKNRAYVQNSDTNAYLEGKFNTKLDKAGGTMTGDLKAAGTNKYTTALVRNIVSGSVSEIGAIGSKTNLPEGTVIIYTP